MGRRHLSLLAVSMLAIPLLALIVACSSLVDELKQYVPAHFQGGGTPATIVEATEPPGEPVSPPVTAISSRTTPGHIWAEPEIVNLIVSIPIAAATMEDHFHFEVPGASAPMRFIGYQVDGLFHIRAAVCPNCSGQTIEYGKGVLSCSNCGQTFDLKTGQNTSGGQGYPQGVVPISVSDESLSSPLHSLTVAYDRTAAGEDSLFGGPAVPYPLGCTNC